KKLPGVGSKSAERFAFHLIQSGQKSLEEMASAIQEIPTMLKICPECGALSDIKNCAFCDPLRATYRSMCIISSPKDAFMIDGTQEFKGFYHVLGSLLSPMDGIGPEKLNIEKLKNRLLQLEIEELVIALDSTLEGDATALYLKEELKSFDIHISRLAFGLPMGSSLDYVDGGTLAKAFSGRAKF
ncbi:MAG TPA: recombination mediator RecR, partial [Parachlamydiaceae bacterium]|nr:recombination mediator RecR [Parachlamydiaceae bacterium]